MSRLFGATLVCLGLALASCAPAPGPRDADAPFGATTRFDARAFAGDWHEVARFAAPGAPLPPYRHSFRPVPGALIHSVSLAGRELRRERLVETGTGWLRPPKGAPLAVLWVDEGFRTAVLGTRSGDRLLVLDRDPRSAPDRMAAAREILQWYGYDMDMLREVAQ
ncbi:lipocalin [Maritimibacter sp. 55A14]|uniref:lipocalin n=1 Tax=Maritimibacter sp. 55A14 TaxID=2174844 RepID=UPI000D621EE4|nr:lipocalin [Maritimibacter sp. 55A14]PWE33851.1 lipocalin [Maritimibacter sp. 55A14]